MTFDPKPGKQGPSIGRIVLWIAVAGIGLYMVVTGLLGVLVKG